MKRIQQSLVLLTTAVLLVFVVPACSKKKNNDTPSEKPGKIQGLGDMAGVPTGTDFSLPANVSLATSIVGSSCDSNYERGSGEMVDVCVVFLNSSTSSITLTLPSGLFILAENDTRDQHGIVLQETKIALKPGAFTRVSLGSYCVNLGKSISGRDKKYRFGKVTDSKLVRELISLLAGKKINKEDYLPNYTGYGEAAGVAQDAIWAISDGEGLDAEIKANIAALPNK